MMAWQDILVHTRDAARAFAEGLRDPLAAQRGQLDGILAATRDTRWGRQHAVADIESVEDFQAWIPLCDYDDVAADMTAIAEEEEGIRFAGIPRFMETTGGSTGGAKWIPFPDAALAALQRGLYPWLHDLLLSRPAIMRGRSYWAISPPRRSLHPETVIPLGIDNDALYFGERLAACLSEVMVVPARSGEGLELAQWREDTLVSLLATEDLGLISVWSPTFLSDLFNHLDDNLDEVLGALARNGHRRRAEQIAAILAQDTRELTAVWPCLDTVSCWTEGSAQAYLPALRSRLPGVHVQGKGLLATEGMVTLPLAEATHPVLAIHSGFYEFLDEAGKAHLCDDLETDQTYEVVLTTWGGLYRYRLGDRVRLRGYYHATPMFSFEGRAGLVSDLCGEKLSEDFVAGVLREAEAGQPGLAMLVPATRTRNYVLVVDAARHDEASARELARRCDRGLRANPQYALARDLGQLSAIEAVRVEAPWPRYRDFLLSRGARLGDIKPPVLGIQPGLMEALSPVVAGKGMVV